MLTPKPSLPGLLNGAVRRCLFAAIVGLAWLVLPSTAFAEGIEILDVRTDQYPRVIVRFIASEADGSPVTSFRPGQLQVFQNGAAQEGVDYYSMRDTAPELWLALVIDVSGSMNDDNKLAQAKEAAKSFVSRLRSRDRTAIVTFSNVVTLHQQPTGDPGTLNRAIDSLKAQGPTRLNDGLLRGVQEVMRGREGGRRAVIVLSDGEDTNSQTELENAVKPAIDAKIPVYTIGFGKDAKGEVLSEIAQKTGARFYNAPEPNDLNMAFRLLSGRLSHQFEAWWQSSTVAPAGALIGGRIALDRGANLPLLESEFTYAMPIFLRQIPKSEPVVTSSLRPVEAPDAGWELPEWWPYEAALLAAFGVFAAYYGLILRGTRTRLQTRMQAFVASYQPDSRAQLRQALQPETQTLRPLIMRAATVVRHFTPAHQLEKLRHRLVLAGRPSGWHFSQFLASKVILAAALGGGGYALSMSLDLPPTHKLLIPGTLAGMGYYLPQFWLSGQVRARQKAIQRALPDALDLITVGVGAGLSFDGAVLELVQKSDNALTNELANFLAELRMGRSRREALQGLQQRTDVDDLKVLVASLLQAEELGMSLSDTLMTQADQMRVRRRQRAEELAHKATIKMMFPMIMMIFPALFIVIIGPAVPGMMAYLGGG